MKIIREKIQVEEFSYFKICYSEDEENILSPTLKKNHQNCYELCLHVHLILENCQFVGTLSQRFCLQAQNPTEELQLLHQEITDSLTNELLQPFFQLLNRLVYEITKITFNDLGIKLSFITE
ncbi:DUF1149 family protein [Enterococcus sp. DIV1283b]|uniref:DUF1149 family protein n=1 Tax=Enterococcus sp. DIV1283b TaxID=2774745 RepID=UPI00383D70AC